MHFQILSLLFVTLAATSLVSSVPVVPSLSPMGSSSIDADLVRQGMQAAREEAQTRRQVRTKS